MKISLKQPHTPPLPLEKGGAYNNGRWLHKKTRLDYLFPMEQTLTSYGTVLSIYTIIPYRIIHITANQKLFVFLFKIFHKKCRCLCRIIVMELYKFNYIIKYSHKYLNTKMFRICVHFYGLIATKPVFSEKHTK